MTTAHRPSFPPQSAFAGFRFPPDAIVLAVRWYLRFGLSYRDVEELLAERGVEVDHVTVHRWVLRGSPRCWLRPLGPAGTSSAAAGGWPRRSGSPRHRPARASHRRVRLAAARREGSSPVP